MVEAIAQHVAGVLVLDREMRGFGAGSAHNYTTPWEIERTSSPELETNHRLSVEWSVSCGRVVCFVRTSCLPD